MGAVSGSDSTQRAAIEVRALHKRYGGY